MFGEDAGFEELVRIATMVGKNKCEELDGENTREKEDGKSQRIPNAEDEKSRKGLWNWQICVWPLGN